MHADSLYMHAQHCKLSTAVFRQALRYAECSDMYGREWHSPAHAAPQEGGREGGGRQKEKNTRESFTDRSINLSDNEDEKQIKGSVRTCHQARGIRRLSDIIHSFLSQLLPKAQIHTRLQLQPFPHSFPPSLTAATPPLHGHQACPAHSLHPPA